ncbi:MAG: hypothetical protein V2A71_00350, partial [Candidatus Eisenbacteria bacterium]
MLRHCHFGTPQHLLVACFLALFAVACVAQSNVQAQVTGISYTLSPIVEGVSFEDESGLKDAALFGGKLGFGFGEFIELNGLYVVGDPLRTDFGGLPGFDDATTVLLSHLPSRDTELHMVGGELKFNLGRSALLPFVTLGTGVVRFVPDDLNDSKVIYLRGGVGLQYSFRDRYAIVAQAN